MTAAPKSARSAADSEQHNATLDALAHYAARHLEDGVSDDPDTRRRYGRLIGLLAAHAELAYAYAQQPLQRDPTP